MDNNNYVHALTCGRSPSYPYNTNHHKQNQINNHLNHTYILCGDFNRDITLIGQQNGQQTTPPQIEDYQWRTFTSHS